MARSLGLTAYRTLTRRGSASDKVDYAPRPKGELLWVHASEPGNFLAVQDFAERLCTLREGLSVVITVSDAKDVPNIRNDRAKSSVIVLDAPTEHPAATRHFVHHWRPDCCLWTWGALRPNLVLEFAATGQPMYLADTDASAFDGRRDRWLPDLTRAVLNCFALVLTRDERTRKRLIQLGTRQDRIEVSATLTAGGQALACSDGDLTDLSAAIGGRPVWFATQVLPQEISTVIKAHRKAMRLSHRLLLILQPIDPDQIEATKLKLAEQNQTFACWDEGAYPDDTTQVLLATDPQDRGLFFRMAPVSFLGSSLVQGPGGCDPFDAATLGSAVLYGPKVHRYLPYYSRLASAGAARIVNDATALGTAVSRLIAPDQAATMAHAGWDVISQGAALTDQLIDLIQNALDDRLAGS